MIKNPYTCNFTTKLHNSNPLFLFKYPKIRIDVIKIYTIASLNYTTLNPLFLINYSNMIIKTPITH